MKCERYLAQRVHLKGDTMQMEMEVGKFWFLGIMKLTGVTGEEHIRAATRTNKKLNRQVWGSHPGHICGRGSALTNAPFLLQVLVSLLK